MERTSTLIIAALMIALTAFAAGQDKPAAAPASALPSVDQVLEKHLQAIGGKAAIQKLTSRVAKGTLEGGGFGADVEIYAKAPNKSLVVVSIAGFGTIQEGFNGSAAWAQDPQSGLRDRTGSELSAVKRDEDFYRDIKLRELYAKMEVKAKEKVGDREAYLVVATPADGSPDKLYFDVVSGLLIRQDIERETSQGKIPLEVYLEDYREVDGLKIAHKLRQNSPLGTFVIKLTEVKHNVAIDDARFNKPAAQ